MRPSFKYIIKNATKKNYYNYELEEKFSSKKKRMNFNRSNGKDVEPPEGNRNFKSRIPSFHLSNQ